MNYLDRRGVQFLFLNLGHLYDHLFMLLYATAVVAMAKDPAFQGSYGFLLALSTASFVAFGAGSIPAGWLGDKWSKHGMITVFFIGIGTASILTGLATGPYAVAAGLLAIGVCAAIYHPVGIAMVAENARSLGKELGINGVFGNFGVAAAAIVAGTLTDLISWRAAFIIPGVVSIATGLAYMVFSRNAPEPHHLAKKDKFIGATRSEIRRAIAVVDRGGGGERGWRAAGGPVHAVRRAAWRCAVRRGALQLELDTLHLRRRPRSTQLLLLHPRHHPRPRRLRLRHAPRILDRLRLLRRDLGHLEARSLLGLVLVPLQLRPHDLAPGGGGGGGGGVGG